MNKVKKFWLIAAILTFASSLQAKLLCFVSHKPLTEAEQKLLESPEALFRVRCEEAGYIVTENTLALVARSANLYNLKYMNQVMRGFAGLRGMAAAGSMYKKLGEMSEEERDGVRAIFGDSFVIHDFGALVAKNDTSVALSARRTLTLTNGRRDIVIRLPEPSGKVPEGFFQAVPTDEEATAFKKDNLAKMKKVTYPDALLFTFRSSEQASVLRTNTTMEICKELSEVLEAQSKAFVSSRNALLAAMMGDKMPEEGQSWLTLDEGMQRYCRDQRDNGFAALGFASKEEADRFFFDARVRSVSVTPIVSIGSKDKQGNSQMVGTSTDVKRNN